MTSPYSTVPYNLEDLYKILSLTDSLKGMQNILGYPRTQTLSVENVGTRYGGCVSLLSK